MSKGASIQEGYETLAIEIVRQAVDDYKQALRFKSGKGISKKSMEYIRRYEAGESLNSYYMTNYINPYLIAESTIKECERFFRSDKMLLYAPNINGERIITTMRDKFSKTVPNYYEENK